MPSILSSLFPCRVCALGGGLTGGVLTGVPTGVLTGGESGGDRGGDSGGERGGDMGGFSGKWEALELRNVDGDGALGFVIMVNCGSSEAKLRLVRW
jgi:hypothetical protein